MMRASLAVGPARALMCFPAWAAAVLLLFVIVILALSERGQRGRSDSGRDCDGVGRCRRGCLSLKYAEWASAYPRFDARSVAVRDTRQPWLSTGTTETPLAFWRHSSLAGNPDQSDGRRLETSNQLHEHYRKRLYRAGGFGYSRCPAIGLDAEGRLRGRTTPPATGRPRNADGCGNL